MTTAEKSTVPDANYLSSMHDYIQERHLQFLMITIFPVCMTTAETSTVPSDNYLSSMHDYSRDIMLATSQEQIELRVSIFHVLRLP